LRFGILEMDPASSPAVLDTATWDAPAACRQVLGVPGTCWQALHAAATLGAPLPASPGYTPHAPSLAHHGGGSFFLATLADGQQVFTALDAPADTPLGEPLARATVEGELPMALYAADAAAIDRYCRLIAPGKGPRPLGAVPRLGIGTRMSTAVWPGVWQAMAGRGFAANAIQNSVRELNLLANLLAGRPADSNYGFSFGRIESGYTGSTFEGLWVAGTLSALQNDGLPRFGADCDHIQVKRGADGLARAKQTIDAGRYFTFFTLDVSDVLAYGALALSPAKAMETLAARIPDARERREVLAYHRSQRRIGAHGYGPDEATLGRLVGKYWDALAAVEAMYEHLMRVRDGRPCDLELSIDEHPSEVPTFDCLTTDDEILFLLLEAQRRGIPLTHVAPNFGVEKGVDYSCPDGLEGLERRARSQAQIAVEMGVMLDFHSGDDLSATTRRAIGRATHGRCHFKVSPQVHMLFAEVLEEHDPDLFRRWWDDAVAYARGEAEGGSPLAIACLRQLAKDAGKPPAAEHMLFHNYGFRYVGQRNAEGQFPQRAAFYTLPPDFYRAYQERLAEYLTGLADDLFGISA
jgi:tagaturonate epimerase